MDNTRPLTHEFKLVARTAKELHDAFNQYVLKLASSGLKFRGRKIGNEGVLNALIVGLFTLPEDQREAFIRWNIEQFEKIMESGEPFDLRDLQPVPPPVAPGKSNRSTADRKSV